MRIKIDREQIIPATGLIGGVVEKRQTLPILGNILFRYSEGSLELVATDLEVEVKTRTLAVSDIDTQFTLPAKKFIDICKALPEGAEIDISITNERASIVSGKSRFKLSTLPATDYPNIEVATADFSFDIQEGQLKSLIEKTAFAMAHQDVRYYLNGMLLELTNNRVRSVATDGHRLALSDLSIECDQLPNSEERTQVLMPRKAVIELAKLLNYSDDIISVDVSSNYIRFSLGNTLFTTKLIDGKFPDYERVIPSNTEKSALIDREEFRKSLQRASILASDKYKGIRLELDENILRLQAHNPEQEEAEEEISIQYSFDPVTIGFNVGYLTDILNVLDSESVLIELSQTNSSAILKNPNTDDALYVVMPMRI